LTVTVVAGHACDLPRLRLKSCRVDRSRGRDRATGRRHDHPLVAATHRGTITRSPAPAHRAPHNTALGDAWPPATRSHHSSRGRNVGRNLCSHHMFSSEAHTAPSTSVLRRPRHSVGCEQPRTASAADASPDDCFRRIRARTRGHHGRDRAVRRRNNARRLDAPCCAEPTEVSPATARRISSRTSRSRGRCTAGLQRQARFQGEPHAAARLANASPSNGPDVEFGPGRAHRGLSPPRPRFLGELMRP